MLYLYISTKSDNKKGMANIFQGVIHQFSRNLQVFLQKTEKENSDDYWRPGVICLNKDSFVICSPHLEIGSNFLLPLVSHLSWTEFPPMGNSNTCVDRGRRVQVVGFLSKRS